MSGVRKSPLKRGSTKEKRPAKKGGATVGHHSGTQLPVLLECGCAVGRSLPDATVDPAIKRRNKSRLRRIEGQLRGIQRMIDEDRQCSEIVVQLASVSGALRGVSKDLVKHHLRHCVERAVREGDASADATFDELVELFFPKGSL